MFNVFKGVSALTVMVALTACASSPSTSGYSSSQSRLDSAVATMAPMKVKDAEECFAAVEAMRQSFAGGDAVATKGAQGLADLWYKKYMLSFWIEGSVNDKPKTREQVLEDSVYGKAPTAGQLANPASLGESDAKKMVNTKFCTDLGLKAIKAR